MWRVRGLCGVVSRRGQARRTALLRCYNVSWKHLPDTPSQSPLYLQPALLPPNKIGDSISPGITAHVTSSSDKSSIIDCSKELGEEKKELTMPLKSYKLVFWTPRKTLWKAIIYWARQVSLLHACCKAENSSRLRTRTWSLSIQSSSICLRNIPSVRARAGTKWITPLSYGIF